MIASIGFSAQGVRARGKKRRTLCMQRQDAVEYHDHHLRGDSIYFKQLNPQGRQRMVLPPRQ
jgi:hypothetical protein